MLLSTSFNLQKCFLLGVYFCHAGFATLLYLCFPLLSILFSDVFCVSDEVWNPYIFKSLSFWVQVTSLTRSFYVLPSFPFWSNSWSKKRPDGKSEETSSFYSCGHYIQFIFYQAIWTGETPLKLKVSPSSSCIYFLALVQIQHPYFTKQSLGRLNDFSQDHSGCLL